MAASALLLVAATLALEGSEGAAGEGGRGGGGSAGLQALVVLGCIGYTVAYQLSFGPGIFILGSEMFPPAIRGRLLGAQTLWGSACLAVTSEVFPAVADGLGLPVAFGIHLALVLLCLAFVKVRRCSGDGRDLNTRAHV